jgi:hypothetical protein
MGVTVLSFWIIYRKLEFFPSKTTTLPLLNCAFFILLLALPLADVATEFSKPLEANEKREKAELPKPSLAELDAYPSNFEDFYNDNFGARALFIYINNFV